MKIETKIEPHHTYSEGFATVFLRHLVGKNLISADFHRENTDSSGADAKLTLRQLWEASDISAHDFAEEVAAFYDLRRISLPELIASDSLTGRFTQRFLREAAMFPFAAGAGKACLAVGDPGEQLVSVRNPNAISALRSTTREMSTPTGNRLPSKRQTDSILNQGRNIIKITNVSRKNKCRHAQWFVRNNS